MSRFTLHNGDSREVLKTLAEASVDSIVTDPPYHLTTGKKGGTGPASVNLESPYGRARVGTGFMGMTWDGGDVAHDASFWAECLRVAKPGAYLAAFGGSRTFHRMVCAIEDAGFEIRDQLAWVYGSGFPKSHNGEWGGTALKPAWEPIVLARKPLIGTVEANWQQWGTGALNIDGCRVPTADGDVVVEFDRAPGNVSRENWRKGTCVGAGKPVERGRWPANLAHDGSDEVVAGFPVTKSGALTAAQQVKGGFAGTVNAYGTAATGGTNEYMASEGSAARFFYCAKASREDRNEGLPSGSTPAVRKNATMREREIADWPERNGNFHPTVKPTDLMRWLIRLVTPADGLVLDPFMGSGSTGKAAMLEGMRFVGIDLTADYVAIARARIDFAARQGHQPSLMEVA